MALRLKLRRTKIDGRAVRVFDAINNIIRLGALYVLTTLLGPQAGSLPLLDGVRKVRR